MKVNGFSFLINSIIRFLATGLGSGFSPIMPGTIGTLAAVFFYVIGLQYLSLVEYVVFLLLATVVGFFVCEKANSMFDQEDHPSVVWDEWVGYWITMLFAPQGWFWIVLGFVLFRYFDIKKPWPISWLNDNCKGGLGIMIDDILAGLIACCCVQAVYYFIKDMMFF